MDLKIISMIRSMIRSMITWKNQLKVKTFHAPGLLNAELSSERTRKSLILFGKGGPLGHWYIVRWLILPWGSHDELDEVSLSSVYFDVLMCADRVDNGLINFLVRRFCQDVRLARWVEKSSDVSVPLLEYRCSDGKYFQGENIWIFIFWVVRRLRGRITVVGSMPN